MKSMKSIKSMKNIYYLKMTQDEIDAYYLVLYYTNSGRRYINTIIDKMVNKLSKYISRDLIYQHNHNKYIEDDSGCIIDELYMELFYEKCYYHSRPYKQSHKNNKEKYRCIVGFTDEEIVIISTISAKVSGDPFNTLRGCLSGNYGTISIDILCTLFGYTPYIKLGKIYGTIAFKK